MTANSKEQSKATAIHLLQHYLRLLAQNANIPWDSDNDTEVALIIESVIEASTPTIINNHHHYQGTATEAILLHPTSPKLPVVASRNKPIVKCPSCGDSSDLAILADGTFYEHFIAWCPCGCVFIRDPDNPELIVPVYSFYTNSKSLT